MSPSLTGGLRGAHKATLFFPEGWQSGSTPHVGAPASGPVVVKRVGWKGRLSQELTPKWAAGQAVSSVPPPVCEVPSLCGDPSFYVVGEAAGPAQGHTASRCVQGGTEA